MRHGRAKAARKTLQYFSRTISGFSTTSSYHVLVDATFVVALHRAKIDDEIIHRMDRLLQVTARKNPVTNQFESPTRYYICQEALEELKDITSKLSEQPGISSDKAKVFEDALDWVDTHCTVLDAVTESKQDDEGDGEGDMNKDDTKEEQKKTRKRKRKRVPTAPTSLAAQAMLKHIRDSNVLNINVDDSSQAHMPYIVATQDEENILDALRRSGTAPLVRLSSATVLLLEQPSKASRRMDASAETNKWTGATKNKSNDDEEELVRLCQAEARRERKRARQQQQALETKGMAPQPARRKRGKAKGANPLSCKKKSNS